MAAIGVPQASVVPTCPPSWVPLITGGAPNGSVSVLDVIDGDAGPTIHAMGSFTEVGGIAATYIASWSAAGWRAPHVFPNTISARVLEFDAGRGPETYLLGSFVTIGGMPAKRIARWTGEEWLEIGGGVSSSISSAAATTSDSGSFLYVSGSFQTAGTTPVLRIASWDGATWSPLGDGLTAAASALTTAAGTPIPGDPPGVLYATGQFTASGEVQLPFVGRWDGRGWSALGGGLDARGSDCLIADLGDGPKLYIVGDFQTAEGHSAAHVASWDGVAWSGLGEGLPTRGRKLEVVDFGDGPRLIASASSGMSGAPSFVMAWDGASWTMIGESVGSVLALAAADLGAGPRLLVGGGFTLIDDEPISRLATFDGERWESFDGPRSGADLELFPLGMLAREEAERTVVHVGGYVIDDDGVAFATAVRVDGLASGAPHRAKVMTMGALPRGYVRSFMEHDDGTGPALHALGTFWGVPPGTTHGLARWNGTEWVILPPLLNHHLPAEFRVAVSFDDGSGSALYVGGSFTALDGTPFANIARLRDGVWEGVGAGLPSRVQALHVHDDGESKTLYAGLDGAVLRWDGTDWSIPGSTGSPGGDDASAPSGLFGNIHALETHDDGSGLRLFAGLNAFHGGSLVYRLDGEAWTPIAETLLGTAFTLRSHDDGTGPALYIGGALTLPTASKQVHGVVRWDGRSMSPVGWGVSSITPPSAPGILSIVELTDDRGRHPSERGAEGANSDRRGARSLVMVGEFARPLDVAGGGVAGNRIAIWGDGGAPVVAADPSSVVSPLGGLATFTTSTLIKSPPIGSSTPPSFQWRRDGVELSDGPGPGGSITGAQSPILSIVGVGAGDAGVYDAVIHNGCGSATTFPALLSIACTGDLNLDGIVDSIDLGRLLAAWSTTDPVADLDGDGIVSDADLTILLAAWGCLA